MVWEMVAAYWRMQRLKSIETALFDYEMVLHEAEIEKKFTTFDVGIQLAVAFSALADESRSLSLLIRYESRLQRVHERALNALLALRRLAKAVPPELALVPPQPIREPEIKNDETNPAPPSEPVPEPSK